MSAFSPLFFKMGLLFFFLFKYRLLEIEELQKPVSDWALFMFTPACWPAAPFCSQTPFKLSVKVAAFKQTPPDITQQNYCSTNTGAFTLSAL